MSIEPLEQFNKIITDTKNPLILLPQNPDGDSVGSGWAFYFFLKKIGSNPTIAFHDPLNNIYKFDFLPVPKNIQKDMLGAREFILSFDTTTNKIINIHTEEKDNQTLIYITPEHGSIDPRDFSFVPAKFKYDLLICLNSPDKESFGKIFEDNPDIFYEIPVINIDHHSNNDSFGQINIVEITASSTSEIAYSIIKKNNFKLNKKLSDCLLTGIIDATNSFQNESTTPYSLKIASELMTNGANQQEIIRHLYKTQPFNILKLLGRIMSKLKWDSQIKLTWATVSIEDFVQSRTEPKNIPTILNKIKDHYSDGDFFLILYPAKEKTIHGILKIANLKMLKKMNSELFKNGVLVGDLYNFKMENVTLNEAEKFCTEKIKSLVK